MKILIVKTFPLEVNTLTYNCQEVGLAVALRKAGHECDIMCVADNGHYHEKFAESEGRKVKVYCLKSFNVKDNAWFRGAEDILNRYDILQAGEYNEIFTWHLAGKYPDKTVVYHGPYYSPYMWKYNRMAKIFDKLFLGRYKRLTTTFITKSRLAEQYLRDKGLENVHTIGVGTSCMQSTDAGETALCRRIKAADGVKLLYVGIIDDRRNVLFLLDVLAEVLKRGTAATLVLVGKFGNEEYKEAFCKETQAKGLGGNIIHEAVVTQSDLPQVYKACDIFLFPTRYDIYGMVLLEAMQHGLITISTLCGGSQMMIESGANGYVINRYDADEWAATIAELVDAGHRAKTMRTAAATTIASRFTWDTLAARFVDTYSEKILQSNK